MATNSEADLPKSAFSSATAKSSDGCALSASLDARTKRLRFCGSRSVVCYHRFARKLRTKKDVSNLKCRALAALLPFLVLQDFSFTWYTVTECNVSCAEFVVSITEYMRPFSFFLMNCIIHTQREKLSDTIK